MIQAEKRILAAAKTIDGDYRVQPVEVYRCSLGDCTNGGITSVANTIGVICPEGYERSSTCKLPLFKVRELGGVMNLVGCDWDGSDIPGWAMAGGNIGYTSDSRFREHISQYPLQIHDRYE